MLNFTAAEWDAFIGGIHNGEFDRRQRQRLRHRPAAADRVIVVSEHDRIGARIRRIRYPHVSIGAGADHPAIWQHRDCQNLVAVPA